MINKAFKYRIYPTEEQKVLLSKMFGCSRFVWNHFLNKEKTNYLNNKEKSEEERTRNYLGFYENCRSLTQFKKEENTAFLKEANSQSLQSTLKDLETAYKRFFNGIAKFPKFKSKQNRQSITIPQHLSIEQDKLYIPKFQEGIKINVHRPYEGRIITSTLSKTPTNKYFVSVVCETNNIEQYPKNDNIVGIDLGIKSFAVCSDGTSYNRKEKFLHAQEKKLKYLQRQASNTKKKKGIAKPKTKGSNNQKKAFKKVADVHESITNKRTDFLQKTSTEIVKKNNIIVIEDLSVKNMVKNHKLAKAISDCSWSRFVSMIEYKSKWHDRKVVKINRFFPSSKTCFNCGWIKEDLTLKDREWVCQNCGVVHDRDHNAAQNIKKQGVNLLENQENKDNCLIQDRNLPCAGERKCVRAVSEAAALNTDRSLTKVKWKKQKPAEASTLVESVKQEANLLKGW